MNVSYDQWSCAITIQTLMVPILNSLGGMHFQQKHDDILTFRPTNQTFQKEKDCPFTNEHQIALNQKFIKLPF